MPNLLEKIAYEVHIKLTSAKEFLSRQEVTASVILVNLISYHKSQGDDKRYTQQFSP